MRYSFPPLQKKKKIFFFLKQEKLPTIQVIFYAEYQIAELH